MTMDPEEASSLIIPFMSARLHGVLDDIVSVTYILAAWLLNFSTAGWTIAIGGALVHFLLTRTTNYPQGQLKWIDFRTHAYVELMEGVAVIVLAWAFLGSEGGLLGERVALTFLGANQFVAFAFTDYRWPQANHDQPA